MLDNMSDKWKCIGLLLLSILLGFSDGLEYAILPLPFVAYILYESHENRKMLIQMKREQQIRLQTRREVLAEIEAHELRSKYKSCPVHTEKNFMDTQDIISVPLPRYAAQELYDATPQYIRDGGGGPFTTAVFEALKAALDDSGD